MKIFFNQNIKKSSDYFTYDERNRYLYVYYINTYRECCFFLYIYIY